VRELENALSRALVMSAGNVIASQDLALATRGRRQRASSRRSFEVQETAALLASLQANRWNVSAVSRQLGIPRNTLYRKLKRYNLDRVTSDAT
jgi:transcriptional regulator of acetoin/glycerol metabolism